jgi:hypothetical protein
MSASHYQVSGDRQGTVTVTDPRTGEVIRTFEMDAGVVVRETFLLEDGKVVAACQKDHAVFWDLETGGEIRRFLQRIYGFSHDEKKFFTYEKKVFLYAYPEMTQICQLSRETAGLHSFQFSPNDRFLAIKFMTGYPASDEYYPRRELKRRNRGRIDTEIFNLENYHEIQEFSQLPAINLGQFSQDSRFYDFKKVYGGANGNLVQENWRFDLENYSVSKLTD